MTSGDAVRRFGVSVEPLPLRAPPWVITFGGGILMGILIGLLISSKMNYRLFIVFLIFVGLWRVLFETSAPQRILQLKKGIFLFIVALLVYLPLYGYDQYVNDFKKEEKGDNRHGTLCRASVQTEHTAG